MSDYMTMREIGGRLKLTSHQVGRKLKELGLRTPEGRPSRKAFEAALCSRKWDGEHYLWAWDAEKVLQLLGGQERQVEADPSGPGERNPR
jgi:hypothetical protein